MAGFIPSLAGKIALVTRASRGFGRAIAQLGRCRGDGKCHCAIGPIKCGCRVRVWGEPARHVAQIGFARRMARMADLLSA